jgi:RNA polymerase sigma-70 factor (ECF subfamily)
MVLCMKVERTGAASLTLGASLPMAAHEGQRTRGLEERIEKLFDELRGPLYRYLLCLSVNSAEADEIVQETFLRLYMHLHSGGGDDNLRGWTFRVAHNISINELKRQKHVARNGFEQWPESNPSTVDSMLSPEEALIRREKMLRIHAAMSTLSEQQNECVHLRAEGFRYREIAEILGVTISTVAESLRRAIRKLSEVPNA